MPAYFRFNLPFIFPVQFFSFSPHFLPPCLSLSLSFFFLPSIHSLCLSPPILSLFSWESGERQHGVKQILPLQPLVTLLYPASVTFSDSSAALWFSWQQTEYRSGLPSACRSCARSFVRSLAPLSHFSLLCPPPLSAAWGPLNGVRVSVRERLEMMLRDETNNRGRRYNSRSLYLLSLLLARSL